MVIVIAGISSSEANYLVMYKKNTAIWAQLKNCISIKIHSSIQFICYFVASEAKRKLIRQCPHTHTNEKRKTGYYRSESLN